MNNIPLSVKFSSERLRRYLIKNPHEAIRLAIAHFEDHSVLAIKLKDLELKNQELKNIKLGSAKTHSDVTLPAFLNPDRGAS